MVDSFITFTLDHPTITGIMVGGGFIGGPLAVIGWCLGYEHAMRKVMTWTRRKPATHVYGDVPNLPKLPSGSIERRVIPMKPGRRA